MQEQIGELREQLEIERKIANDNEKRAEESERMLDLERAKNQQTRGMLEIERASLNAERRNDFIDAVSVFTKNLCCCKCNHM
jgi:hypothetical protein